jgi:hypothetical protein
MKTPSNDGGAALPVVDGCHEDGRHLGGESGMTLRDYFAGQALAGLNFKLTLQRWWSAIDKNGRVIDGYRCSIRGKLLNLHEWEHEETKHDKGNDAEELALAAYAFADAMLAVRGDEGGREMSTSTCTHHTDSERIACPVCLVAALTAELHQLRSDCENETKWAAHYLAQSIADKARADKAENDLATERARLDHVLKNDWPFCNRDEIDKDIKEGAK